MYVCVFASYIPRAPSNAVRCLDGFPELSGLNYNVSARAESTAPSPAVLVRTPGSDVVDAATLPEFAPLMPFLGRAARVTLSDGRRICGVFQVQPHDVAGAACL